MTVAKLLAALAEHHGRARGITVARLAGRMDCVERRVRELVKEAREEGHPVCGHPRDGYYIAATPEELEETIEFLKSRALCSLVIASKLTRQTLPEMIGQLQLSIKETDPCPA